MKTFIEGIKTPIQGLVKYIKNNEGKVLSEYIPWATALQLAGRPPQEVIQFDGLPYLPMLGGGVVAVKQGEQITWLPIMDSRYNPIPQEAITSRDISDSISRCRAKSVAINNGIGISLHAGWGENTIALTKALGHSGVTPDAEELSEVQPLISHKNQHAPYIQWAVALAALKITDPDAWWEVKTHEFTSSRTGEMRKLPIFKAGHGYMVAVTIHWKGLEHTEWLAITGFAKNKNGKNQDHQPLHNPSVTDWNKSVMRCLAKGIAVLTGYGISVYAHEDAPENLQREPVRKKGKPKAAPKPPATEVNAEVTQEQSSDASTARQTSERPPENAISSGAMTPEVMSAIQTRLEEMGKTAEDLIEYLGIQSLEEADEEILEVIARTLNLDLNVA